MGRKTAEVSPGDIFMIPLFLPSQQMDEYILDYSKYRFHLDDIYAFGRLIEIQAGNVDLIEVFSYTGNIPQNPEIIIHSGRMFAPEHIGHPFCRKGRWQVIFSDPHYDMWKDSDYENITFLSPIGHMWKGKEEIKITKEKRIELKEAGIPDWIFHSRIDLEVRIRSVLEARGIELNMSGNGYDWEKVASAFIEKQGTDSGKKFSFDCEADTFSMSSSSKKMLKEFSISFHKLVMDTSDFEEFLSQLS